MAKLSLFNGLIEIEVKTIEDDELREQELREELEELLGKTLVINYGDSEAEIRYQLNELHWTLRQGDQLSQGSERPSYQLLEDDKYLVTWQEADGTVISQVLNLWEEEVQTYVYAPLQDSNSPRLPQILLGTLRIQGAE